MEGVEPMYEYIPEISEEFAGPPNKGPYMPSASVAYSFNRYLPSGGGSYKTGWTPIYDADPYADSLYNRCKFEEEAIATVKIDRLWDESSRTVTGKVTVNFEHSPGSGDYRIGLYVVEDSIQGPFPSYLQWSDYAFPSSTDSAYVFDDVLRGEILAGSIWGKTGIIPSNPQVNSDYSVNFSYTVPAIMYDIAPRVEHLSLVGYVTSYFPPEAGYSGPHGEIYNVEEVALAGDDVKVLKLSNLNLNEIQIKRSGSIIELSLLRERSYDISIFSLQGKKLKSVKVSNSKGLEKLNISNLTSGTLVIKVKGEAIDYTRSMINIK